MMYVSVPPFTRGVRELRSLLYSRVLALSMYDSYAAAEPFIATEEISYKIGLANIGGALVLQVGVK